MQWHNLSNGRPCERGGPGPAPRSTPEASSKNRWVPACAGTTTIKLLPAQTPIFLTMVGHI
jgi:hypothetical protein